MISTQNCQWLNGKTLYHPVVALTQAMSNGVINGKSKTGNNTALIFARIANPETMTPTATIPKFPNRTIPIPGKNDTGNDNPKNKKNGKMIISIRFFKI